jgi:hypothetical protein
VKEGGFQSETDQKQIATELQPGPSGGTFGHPSLNTTSLPSEVPQIKKKTKAKIRKKVEGGFLGMNLSQYWSVFHAEKTSKL